MPPNKHQNKTQKAEISRETKSNAASIKQTNKKHSLLHGNPVIDGPGGLLHVPLVHEHRRRQQLHRGVVTRSRVAQPHLEGSDYYLPTVRGRQIPCRKPHRLEGRGGVVLDLSASERESRRFARGGVGSNISEFERVVYG